MRRKLWIIDCTVLNGEGRGWRDPCALEVRLRPQAQDIGRRSVHLYS
jgi:hypothetical protein